jgi:hypothetical protein
MPFNQQPLSVIQCDVPGCGMTRFFVGPNSQQNLQTKGWLMVYRMGDDGTHKKQYICPEHAKLLNLPDNWVAPTMQFTDGSALQEMLDIKPDGTREPRRTLDSGDFKSKTLLDAPKEKK